jgi:hypothetical protein
VPRNAGYVAANAAVGDSNYVFDWGLRRPLADALESAGGVTINGGFGDTINGGFGDTVNGGFGDTISGGFDDTISPLSLSLPHTAANRVYTRIDTQDNMLANTSLATPVATLAPTNHGERKACNHVGCGKTFGRLGDLRRHAGVHSPPELLCCVKGCERKFYRVDKLRDHQRHMHKTAV